MPGFLFHTESVDDMTMTEYLKSVRMTDAERKEWADRYSIHRDDALTFVAAESYDAHSHHAEYGGARH